MDVLLRISTSLYGLRVFRLSSACLQFSCCKLLQATASFNAIIEYTPTHSSLAAPSTTV